MAYSVANQIGIDLNNAVATNPSSWYSSTATYVPTFGPLGMQVFGSDGKRYVFGKASTAITASTATCDINATTFAVAATGGSYTSPPVDLAAGDYAWFGKSAI